MPALKPVYSALFVIGTVTPSKRCLEVDKLRFLSWHQIHADHVEPDLRRGRLRELANVLARQPAQHFALVIVDGNFGGGSVLSGSGLYFDDAK